MRVFLVRHGVPEEGDYDVDDDPSLSDEGQEIVEAIAAWMIDEDEVPNVIIASPMSRTQETADILRDAFTKAGYVIPAVKSDVSIGPKMSIKGLIQSIAKDDDMTRVMLVSHHETIASGMRVLDRPDHPDPMAMGELRILKVKRDDGSWKEKERVLPSDVGQSDHY
jgi:phosphohistidine phosphatase SixA